MRIPQELSASPVMHTLPRVLHVISLVCRALTVGQPTRTHFLHAGIAWVEVIGIHLLAICADDQSRLHFLHFLADACHIEI